jgi:N-acyl homoserine lactone hydrolase
VQDGWKILPLLLCEVTYPPGHPRSGEVGPVYAFLLRRGRESLLIDTGIGPPHAEIDSAYRTARRDLRHALAEQDLEPEDVEGVILTHLHFDHVGMAHLFPGVPLYVQRAEWEAACRPNFTVAEWVEFSGANYVLLDGDDVITPGIRVISTPGHTPGHQSVQVETADGVVLVAGQAVETVDDLLRFLAADTGGVPNPSSVARLLDLRPSRILFSHDHSEWRPPR